MTSPLNSAGLRTSTSARVESPTRGRTSSRNARKAEVRVAELDAGRLVGRDVRRHRQAVVQPVLAAAVEDAHVAQPEQLQLPVRPGGEPVVVVAVQHDRRVRADPALRQQLAQVLLRRDVATDPVGELARPVPADRAAEVALLVGGRVDVDLDEADVRIAEMLLGPVGVDEGAWVRVIVMTHRWSSFRIWMTGGRYVSLAGRDRDIGPKSASVRLAFSGDVPYGSGSRLSHRPTGDPGG